MRKIAIGSIAAVVIGAGVLVVLLITGERKLTPTPSLPKTVLASMLRKAHYLWLEGKVDEAIPLLLEVRKQDPRFEAHFPEEKLQLDATAALADCYETKGRWAEALKLWEEVLRAHPDAQVPPVHISRCRAQLAGEGGK